MGKFSRLGNDLYTGRRSINFVGRKWLWYTLSGVIVLLAVAGLYFKGLNMGIEFTGGAQYRVSLPTSQVTQGNADKLRNAVADTGIAAASQPVVVTSGSNAILVQTEPLTGPQSAEVVNSIVKTVHIDPQKDLSQEELGASWGKDVAKRSATGLVVFLVLVVLFIWAYFRQWKMSVAAIVALAHDVLITVGVYALSGFDVSPATVTGLLTILGFSLYDTVVVFDKVRENTKGLRDKKTTYADAANLAVNQTLVRSINTSIVALIPVGAILYVGAVQLGSGSLKDLSLALFVGMAAGAYSSIFIATPLLVQMKSGERDVMDAEKRALKRRQEADRYASVPAFTEDMPVQEEPGTGRGQGLRRGRAGRESRAPRARGRRPRTRHPAGAWPGPPQRRCGSPAAEPAEPLQAGQEVTSGPPPDVLGAAREALGRFVVDVPDFPEPGVLFKDITPLLADHDAFTAVIAALASAGRDPDGNVVVDKVVGMEARGFILAAPVALALGTGFVPVRKAGKLPRETYAVSYALEYGEATLELHRDGIAPGDRVLLVDDVLATGGTVKATRKLIDECGGTSHAVAVLMELGFLPGRETIGDLPLTTLLTV